MQALLEVIGTILAAFIGCAVLGFLLDKLGLLRRGTDEEQR